MHHWQTLRNHTGAQSNNTICDKGVLFHGRQKIWLNKNFRYGAIPV